MSDQELPPDAVVIQHRFTLRDDETGQLFSDALVMPEEEYRELAPEQIDQLKLERLEEHAQRVREASEQVSPEPEPEPEPDKGE